MKFPYPPPMGTVVCFELKAPVVLNNISRPTFCGLKYLLRLTDELDDIFGGSILFNFASSSVIICVVGFLVTTADRIIEVVKYSFTLISSIIQVYIVCLMGDKFIVSVIVFWKLYFNLIFPFHPIASVRMWNTFETLNSINFRALASAMLSTTATGSMVQ